MTQPHIFILMTDQQRADSLGCAGHPQLRTPNIDRIAREGIRLNQATTVSPICMSARASFASGLYPHNHGIWANHGELPATDETFFQLLQSAGYCTAQVGKTHFYDHRAGLDMRTREPYLHARGLELVHETPGPIAATAVISHLSEEWAAKGLLPRFVDDYRARARSESGGVWPSPLAAEDFLDGYIGRKAVELIEHYDDPRPLCLFVGFAGPHDPWDAPLPYATMYRAEETPPPVPIPASDTSLPETVRGKRDFAAFPQPMLANLANIRANYYGKISLIDDEVGRILDALERKGWLDNAFVVFVSDHGEMLGDHGRFKKSTFHESNVRIPMLARWPGRIAPGGLTDALVEIVDLFPTLVEAGGGKPSIRCLGRSLWPLIDGEVSEVKQWQLSEVVYGEARVMLRSRQWKLAVDASGVAYMLYDLERDPDEQRNLVADPGSADARAALKGALAATLAELRYGPGMFPGLA